MMISLGLHHLNVNCCTVRQKLESRNVYVLSCGESHGQGLMYAHATTSRTVSSDDSRETTCSIAPGRMLYPFWAHVTHHRAMMRSSRKLIVGMASRLSLWCSSLAVHINTATSVTLVSARLSSDPTTVTMSNEEDKRTLFRQLASRRTLT